MQTENPVIWTTFGEWLANNNLGEIASVLGVLISLVGFGFTLWNVQRSKKAAIRAEAAAEEAKESIRFFDTVSDFSVAISTMDEIRRLHRENAWSILPDRYTALKKLLVTLRSANPNLTEKQKATIQSVILTLTDIEGKVERALVDGNSPKDVAKFNAKISSHVDGLHEMLVEIKTQVG